MTIERVSEILVAVVRDGLDDYTQFGDGTRFTKVEVTGQLYAAIASEVEAQLDAMLGICPTIKKMLTLHIVSCMLKLCKTQFDTFAPNQLLSNINVMQIQEKITAAVRSEVENQLKPYVALLGLCKFPEMM